MILDLVQPRLQQWREMFDSFDDNKDGIIDAGELAKALNHYQYAYLTRSCCARHF
jgi:Ca2+-binding EF-hand superfamily protein